MKKFNFMALLGLCFIFGFQSCQNEDAVSEEEVLVNNLSVEILQKLAEAQINTNNSRIVDFYLPDGSTKEMIEVEGDIYMSEADVLKLGTSSEQHSRNYRTNNLVSQGRQISIVGYTGGGGSGLSSKERTALQWAVDNYNQLKGISISFNLTFGTNYSSQDMVVYHNPNQSGAGGSAGFPSNGKPNKFVQIYGLDNYDTNVVEHVITHEIGHSIGFRHTDWFNRASCGQNQNEGAGQIGAIDLGGNSPQTSVMLACFSSNEDGEFGIDDINALNIMY